MNYSESTEFLLALPDMERSSHGAKARTMSLDAMRAMLNELANPELGRKTVHITGSKGKGSTSAFLASILSEQAPTSLYSSPHLHSYRERICFDLEPVKAEEFAAGVEAIKQAVLAVHNSDAGPISTFGAMTALFFHLSKQRSVDWQLIEVGMGGRYDATNVIESKELVLISAISLEHTNVLGKSTVEIAENKAGIIRPGCSVVLAPQKDPEVSRVIEECCSRVGARFVDVAAKYEIQPLATLDSAQEFELSSSHGKRRFRTGMLGRHQIDNAATAVAAADVLNDAGAGLSELRICHALETVFVPGRLEVLSKSPPVVIDGAHNGESAAALLESLKRHFACDAAVFVLGVNSDKNIDQIIASLKPGCRKIIATRSKSEKAMDPSLVAKSAAALGIECEIIDSSEAAIGRAIKIQSGNEPVCATGSLYLIAEIREYFLGSEAPWSLKKNAFRKVNS